MLVSAALAAVLGCTTSHQSTAPTAPADATPAAPPVACAFSIIESQSTFDASGGTGSAAVVYSTELPVECHRRRLLMDQDRSRIDIRRACNDPSRHRAKPSFSGRSGAIEIQAERGGAQATQGITQRGAGCLYSIDPPTLTRTWLGTSDGSDVGAFEARVHAEPADCRWTVTPTVPWMYSTWYSRPEGTGDATIDLSILWNSAPTTRVLRSSSPDSPVSIPMRIWW